MAIQDRYLAYADAFEETYADDDWSRIEPYFTEGAVYEGEPDAKGRAAVLAKLKGGIDGFDRRMDSRRVEFEKPTVEGNTLVVRWKGIYTKKGRPDLVLSGTETALFEGDRIVRLRDTFDPAAQKAMGEWMAAHGSSLQGG
jgi:SnoaL-like domain